MSVSTFLLVVALAYAAAGQGTNGGLYNGLRYTFNYGTFGTGTGCTGSVRPSFPTYPGAGSNVGQLCFFLHENHYLYATDCGNTIWDKYVWMGENSTLPAGSFGSGVTGGSSSNRWISDGTYQNLTYSYSGSGFSGYSYNNRYYVLTTNDDLSAITSFSYFYYGTGTTSCSFSFTFSDGTGVGSSYYKPYQSWNFRYAPFRTTNQTAGYGTGWCSYSSFGSGSGYGASVCIDNCKGLTYNQGWYNMPIVVCIETDRHNSYKLTDCLGKTISSLWWTRGGYPYTTPGTTPGTLPTSGNGTYTPYNFPGNSETIAPTLSFGYGTGAGNYGGYYLTASLGNGCRANWKVPLAHATDATNQAPFVPQEGLYRIYSNVPTTTVNSYHFYGYGTGTGYSNGYAGGYTGWTTSCNGLGSNGIYLGLGVAKVTQFCLRQTAVNSWRLDDCTTSRIKTYITFGWNGVSWTGWEGQFPIEVFFDADGWMSGWTGIYNAGMCQYNFRVMYKEEREIPSITDGTYNRVFTPAWDFIRGNRYDFGYGSYGGSYSGYTDYYSYGNCTDIPADTICSYKMGLKAISENDCAGSPLNRYAWSGYTFETPEPTYGVDPMRPYMYIDGESVTEDSYTSYMVRGGCVWKVENSRDYKQQGPAVPWGQYTASDSTTQEGSCKPDAVFDEVGIYPSGLPWGEYAIQDWATGDILVILRWDGSNYVGRDQYGTLIQGIIADANAQWSGIFGYRGNCLWSITYDFAEDFPVLPKITNVPAASDWKFEDAYGVWNAKIEIEEGSTTCADTDDDLIPKYSTLLCVWPNGPAVLNLVQCNDKRDDYQTILQQAWWRGGLSAWVGVDNNYQYTWGYLQDDDKNYEEETFIIAGVGNDGCEFQLRLWRGDDCETNGWKIGISVLSVLCALFLLIAVYFVASGGSAGGSSNIYHEYQ